MTEQTERTEQTEKARSLFRLFRYFCLFRHLVFLLAVMALPAMAQETLQQIESRAIELKSRGDAAGALAAWQQAAMLAPKSARIQDEIGFLLVVLNRREEALQHFERATELDPKFAPAHYHLGVAYWLGQDPSRSIPQLQSAVELDPKNFEYRFLLGHALNDTSNYREARAPGRASSRDRAQRQTRRKLEPARRRTTAHGGRGGRSRSLWARRHA